MSSIKLTSDTLAVSPAGGELEYNGQFFGTDSNNSRAQLERLVLETAKSATGTSVDFTGIPAWVKRITVLFNGISLSGTSSVLVQLGDSGGIENTGYNSTSFTASDAPQITSISSTAGFVIRTGANAPTISGTLQIFKVNNNDYVCSGTFNRDDSTILMVFSAGKKSLSNTLDRVRITTINGTDTFDAGTINILYEG